MNFLLFGKSVHLGSPNLSEPVELREEREKFENAHLLATKQKKPQLVDVEGKKVVVIDTGSGREARPF